VNTIWKFQPQNIINNSILRKVIRNGTFGRAQTVSRRHLIAVARIRCQVRSCGIYGGQSGTGVGFLRILRFPLPILIPTTAPHSPPFIIRGWYNRPNSGRRSKWTVSPHSKKLKKKRGGWTLPGRDLKTESQSSFTNVNRRTEDVRGRATEKWTVLVFVIITDQQLMPCCCCCCWWLWRWW
jgi:hypothetical protein